MADQLTSVRFTAETLTVLRELAEVNSTSVAAEIRAAVDAHIRTTTSEPGFRDRVAEKRAQMEESANAFAAKLLEMSGSPASGSATPETRTSGRTQRR